VLIPILYLKGVSTGDFEEALIALLGTDAGGLSATTIGRLKEAWSEEHARWSRASMQARLEDTAQCLLVIIGATPEGKKELVGLIDGVRESAQSWKELLLDLKRRGLAIGPELAVADGALGFWQAIAEVWPKTRGQRCLGAQDEAAEEPAIESQARAAGDLGGRDQEGCARGVFVETWVVKHDKAVECLNKDRDALLAFYDFPAEHWKHLGTTNVIESSFATVRHRTVRSKGCLSNKTALAMIFKLAEAAERSWRRLNGHNQLSKIILGVSSPTESRLSDSKLKPLPPDSFRHEDSAIARTRVVGAFPDGQSCLNLAAAMVHQVLHENAASLSAATHANRSRRLIKCAKDSGHESTHPSVQEESLVQQGAVGC
jgi:transposase-like protein